MYIVVVFVPIYYETAIDTPEREGYIVYMVVPQDQKPGSFRFLVMIVTRSFACAPLLPCNRFTPNSRIPVGAFNAS